MNHIDWGLVLLTFVSAAAYECGCVFWVHYAELGRRLPAVGWSCFNALVTVIGVEGFLKSRFLAAVFVVGFGCGTFFAMTLKRRLARSAR